MAYGRLRSILFLSKYWILKTSALHTVEGIFPFFQPTWSQRVYNNLTVKSQCATTRDWPALAKWRGHSSLRPPPSRPGGRRRSGGARMKCWRQAAIRTTDRASKAENTGRKLYFLTLKTRARLTVLSYKLIYVIYDPLFCHISSYTIQCCDIQAHVRHIRFTVLSYTLEYDSLFCHKHSTTSRRLPPPTNLQSGQVPKTGVFQNQLFRWHVRRRAVVPLAASVLHLRLPFQCADEFQAAHEHPTGDGAGRNFDLRQRNGAIMVGRACASWKTLLKRRVFTYRNAELLRTPIRIRAEVRATT